MQSVKFIENNTGNIFESGQVQPTQKKIHKYSTASTEKETQEQAQFRRIHQEYIAQKKAQMKIAIQNRKLQFGSSSSSSEDQQDEGPTTNSPKKPVQHNSSTQLKANQNLMTCDIVKETKKYSVEFRYKKSEKYHEEALELGSEGLIVSKKTFQYKTFNKIKIYQKNAVGSNKKIKVTYFKNDEIYIAASPKILISDVPLHYFIFSAIVCEKLNSMGIPTQQTKSQIVPDIPQAIIYNSDIYGKIYKKSQIMGKWEQRFVVMNQQGIFSYRNFSQKPSMSIPSYEIKQIWTRFQLVSGKLIIKVEYNSTKTQFGIPITNFVSAKTKNNWLYQFYRKSVKTF